MMGLVNRIVPKGRALDEAKLANELAAFLSAVCAATACLRSSGSRARQALRLETELDGSDPPGETREGATASPKAPAATGRSRAEPAP
jgi:hypothetical protein